MCVSDRCLTINGITINYITGVKWGQQSNFTESVPFTNIQISIPKSKLAFEVKNEDSSRKLVTFAHRQRDVLLFELLDNQTYLAKLKGSP